MDQRGIERLAMIAGVGAAAMANDAQVHPDGPQKSAAGTKRYRKRRDKKNKTAKAARKRNRR